MPNELRARLLAEAAAYPWLMHPAMLQTLMATMYMRATGHGTAVEVGSPLPGFHIPGDDALTPDAAGALEPSAKMHGNAERALAKKSGAVAIIPIVGVITPRLSFWEEMFGMRSANPALITAAATACANDPDVKAVILAVDSPGGNATGVEECATALRALREKKPIVAQVNGLCASAAYWLASSAEDISVTPTGMVGSVGAYMYHEDWSEAYAQAGVKPTYVQRGQFKTEWQQEVALTEEAKAHIQQMVDDVYTMFTESVATGRGVSLADVQGERFGEGRTFMAARAVERGMADRVRTFADTLAALGGGASVEVRGARGRTVAQAERQLRLMGGSDAAS